MRTALKEWNVVVDALGRGHQWVILRKGGIAEGAGGFRPEHPRFLLFPTAFHQQRASVLPEAQARFDALAPTLPPADIVRLEYHAEVVAWQRLDALAMAEKLRGQHIWTDEVIASRFDWGREKTIHALALRVYRLARPREIPMREAYGGCKSWIEIEPEVPTETTNPVLTDDEFQTKLVQFQRALSQP